MYTGLQIDLEGQIKMQSITLKREKYHTGKIRIKSLHANTILAECARAA
jgi:hypothetical protein